jgi:hypothetical protein
MTTFSAGQRLSAAALNSAFASTPQLISTVTLTGTQATISFAVVANAYTRLTLYWRGQLSTSGPADVTLQVDGNSGTNYLWAKDEGDNGTATSSHAATLTTVMKIGVITGVTGGYFGSGRQDIEGWSSVTGALTCSGAYGNFQVAGTDWAGTTSGISQSAGPHSNLTVATSSGSFAAGSTFSLYGLT